MQLSSTNIAVPSGVVDSRKDIRLLLYGHCEPSLRNLILDPGFRPLVKEILLGDGVHIDHAAQLPVIRSSQEGIVKLRGNCVLKGPRILFVDTQQIASLRMIISPFLASYCDIIQATLPALRSSYSHCSASRYHEWSDVVHSIIAGMLMDLSVGKEISRIGTGHNFSVRQAVVWALQDDAVANPFGVQWSFCHNPHTGLAQLWHPSVRRPDLCVNAEHIKMLRSLDDGVQVTGTSQSWVLLRYQKLVDRVNDGHSHRLLIPAFDSQSIRSLYTIICPTASRLVENIFLPILDRALAQPLMSSFKAHPFAQNVVSRIVLECASDRLVEDGLLPPFPSGNKIPASWGRWLWVESSDTDGLIPATTDIVKYKDEESASMDLK